MDCVEMKAALHRLRHRDVSRMHWIERAAEQRDRAAMPRCMVRRMRR